MPATANSTRRAIMRALPAIAVFALLPGAALAHPMPDTQIIVARSVDRVRLTIEVPLEDLRLALAGGSLPTPFALDGDTERRLRAYFAEHTRLTTGAEIALGATIDAIRLARHRDHDVGLYEELEIVASAPAKPTDALMLHYDGVLHQVANHRAIVNDTRGRRIGVIRYSLARKRTAPLALPPM